jgi:beta-N-acetylhexosaminidase
VVVRLDGDPADLAALLAAHKGRRPVVVARDAARHEWQQAVVAGARTARPDAIVVETGLPSGGASIVTYGAGRANLAAAAGALASTTIA